MAVAFVPPAAAHGGTPIVSAVALVLAAGLLALGAAAAFPFEMDTIVALAGNRLVGTHYGLYNTVVGMGILLGTWSPAPRSIWLERPICPRCRGSHSPLSARCAPAWCVFWTAPGFCAEPPIRCRHEY